MILYEIQMLLITLFLTSVLGYMLVVLKEKLHLRDNTIIIEKKSVTQDFIDEAKVKVFMLGDEEFRTGDEISLITSKNKRVSGIIIGAMEEENEIVLVTHNDEVRKLKVEIIKKIRVISKYGRFFRAF